MRAVRMAVHAKQAQRRQDLRLRPSRGVRVEVGLVNHHKIGQLHHAALDRLQFIARVGQLHQDKHVGHAGNGGFTLTHTHRLNDDHVISSGLKDHHRFARLFGNAPKVAATRAWPDIS